MWNMPTSSSSIYCSQSTDLVAIQMCYSLRVADKITYKLHLVTDRVSTVGNGIASVRPSVRLSVRLLPLYLSNRLTFDLDFLHMYES